VKALHTESLRIVAKTENKYRDQADLLRSRVSLLTGKDRLLMTMYFENGNSFRQLARLEGVNEANVARRIRRISKRLLDDKYVTCLRNRDKFTKREMAIAKDYFLMGLSQRKIASKRNYSVHHVCKTLKRIQDLIITADNS
jgi:predicted DNA-binding protein YlxM (UPF0122 family)